MPQRPSAGAPRISATPASRLTALPELGPPAVLLLRSVDRVSVALLLNRFGLELVLVSHGEEIPGSYWGDSEAGLRGERLFARIDTPVHSIFHEAAHYICMSPERRAGLDTDAGGDDLEECAVCYLQVLLAGELPAVGRARMFADMDSWGYSFRLGSTRAWFEGDAGDARAWLEGHGVIDAGARVTAGLRAR
ncbi:MAG TPA: hypothetical protein VET46_08395 [Steroidobacteraceae bacterium]|nr:hypothetical protein [Steroidobacteraceae bacterium]